MTTTIPEVETDLTIFTELVEGLEPTEPCENPDHDQAPPAKHLWWVHCQSLGFCEDCHQNNIAEGPNQHWGRMAHCEMCHNNFMFGPQDIRYLGPIE